MDNLVTNAVACVSVWYETTPPNAAAGFFCHAAADFCIKRRRASLVYSVDKERNVRFSNSDFLYRSP